MKRNKIWHMSILRTVISLYACIVTCTKLSDVINYNIDTISLQSHCTIFFLQNIEGQQDKVV